MLEPARTNDSGSPGEGHHLSDVHGIHIPVTGTNDYRLTDEPDPSFLITGSFTTAPVLESPTILADAALFIPIGLYSVRQFKKKGFGRKGAQI